jgi:hypothetical protein
LIGEFVEKWMRIVVSLDGAGSGGEKISIKNHAVLPAWLKIFTF